MKILEDDRFYADLMWMYLEKVEKLTMAERRMVVRFFNHVSKPTFLLKKIEPISDPIKKILKTN